MSAHAAIVFAVGLSALMALCAVSFVVWLIAAIAIDLYHHLTRRHTCIRKSELDSSYRTGQFITPNWARKDFK
jgi:hypothetical protein